MSGFCSAHKHHEPGCKQCEMGETMSDGMTDESRRDRALQRRRLLAEQTQILLDAEQERSQYDELLPCCPICGSEYYETVKKNINGLLGPGACIKTLYHICAGCGIMFKDPDRFFRKQEGMK